MDAWKRQAGDRVTLDQMISWTAKNELGEKYPHCIS
jgi:hypothetical protein